jgi:ribosome biogenesis GTPase
MSLESLGWGPDLAESFRSYDAADLRPGRVAASYTRPYRLYSEGGELPAEISGRLRHLASTPSDLPVTGDWVAFRPGDGRSGGVTVIEGVLPRRTRISRKVAGGRTEEQVVAANVDTVVVVMGLDGDFNPRRLERYVVQVWASGAAPLVILNKADACPDPALRRCEVEAVAAGAPVVTLSALSGQGLDRLEPHLQPGRTLLLVGSSGVGKSTLVNRLVGADVSRTRPVRPGDDRGRHTTTHRELIRLPGGALILDTPGLREIQLWSEDEDLSDAFSDVAECAAGCRFRDCRHQDEPRCAVREAVDDGRLSAERLAGYRKLQSELRHLHLRQDQWARLAEKRRWKAIHKAARSRSRG